MPEPITPATVNVFVFVATGVGILLLWAALLRRLWVRRP
jgi:hypothetical protein